MSDKIGRQVARPAQTAEQEPLSTSSPTFAENYPTLWRFLSENRKNEKYDSTGSFTVFWENGVFKVNLNDRPTGNSTFVSHTELGQALLIADRGIRSGTLRWRANKQYRAKAQRVYK